MIKIKRTGCPPSLSNAPAKGTRYKNTEVVKALHEMQHEKCCYCERKIPDEGHFKNVEHFRPKGKKEFLHLKNAWENLLLACAQCNGSKSDLFPVSADKNQPKVVDAAAKGKPLLIDPCEPEIDPERELEFIVDDREEDWGSVKPRNDSKTGFETIVVLNLSSTYHAKGRRTHLQTLNQNWMALLAAKDDKNQESVLSWKKRFDDKESELAEYAACTREFVREKKIAERFPN